MTRSAPASLDRRAWILIRRFGDDAAVAAYLRALRCERDGRAEDAEKWRFVLRRVVEMHFDNRGTSIH